MHRYTVRQESAPVPGALAVVWKDGIADAAAGVPGGRPVEQARRRGRGWDRRSRTRAGQGSTGGIAPRGVGPLRARPELPSARPGGGPLLLAAPAANSVGDPSRAAEGPQWDPPPGSAVEALGACRTGGPEVGGPRWRPRCGRLDQAEPLCLPRDRHDTVPAEGGGGPVTGASGRDRVRGSDRGRPAAKRKRRCRAGRASVPLMG
jgi:hypothetical protein